MSRTDGSRPGAAPTALEEEALSAPPTAYLEVRDLRVHFPTDDGLVKSVDGLSFALDRRRTLGIVGESGSGKSVTSQAVLGLTDGIMKTRGRWLTYDTGTREIRAIATLHPAYLLRQPLQKRLAWRDFLAVRKALGS